MSQPGPYTVPNYDIFGHHHHSKPFKDKSHFLEKDVWHPKWLDAPPGIRSRAELQQARKQGRIPEVRSYDFDGDGVVGQLDYFIGKCFDQDADGRLTTAEKRRAEKALENGFLDKYVRGLDATGQVHKCGPIKQKRGVICGPDSANEASVSTYPPHFNAHHVPEHYTRTALNLSRKAEVKAAGLIAGENWAARCEPVLERQPPNHETHPRDCPITHIRERAEGDHQLARVRGGLMPMSYPVNPERECKTVGMQRVEDPTFRTRGQLLETRKELMKRDNEELRLNGDEYYVPLSIRNGEREVEEFNFRRPKEEPMTLTRLKDNRLKDKIEYDMNHFSFPRSFPREYPKFSDHPDIPFWVSNAEDARIGSSPPQTLSRNHSEPAFKVTELPFGEEPRETYEVMPDSAKALAAGKMTLGRQTELGSKTVKRWSTDMLERGQARNQPRLFDNIRPVRIGPKDLEPLDLTSSMEPIRNAALRRQAEERKKMAAMPKRSRLYVDPSEETHAKLPAQAVGSKMESSEATAQRSTMEPPPSATSAATRMPGRRVPIVTSEPVLRSPVLETTTPKEPRHFGTGTVPLAQATTGYGVRCGGFQHVESAMSMQRPSLRESGLPSTVDTARLNLLVIVAGINAFFVQLVLGRSLVLCLRFSLNVTAGLLNFVAPASRSQVVSIAAVSAALSGAAPSFAEPQSLEE
ncbi:unnamed protein product [Symbiodinium sp. CCMP2592]|nr:unnamed protein product [Symbiodinium sp. CCMP2592]